MLSTKKLDEKLTFEMFNVHTSMTAANEEIEKLSSSNSKLVSRNEHLELMIVNSETLKKEIEYLKSEIVCADQIEKVLRDKLADNELKMKAYQNSYVLVSDFYQKNRENYKIGIGFDYEALKGKNNISHKNRDNTNEKGPHVLKNISNPIFKQITIDFDDKLPIIKQQLLHEDNKDKCESSELIVDKIMKLNANTVKQVDENQVIKKKKPSTNGKVGINKSNNYACVKNAPRKICLKCGTCSHLTYMCKRPKNENKNEFKLGHQIPLIEKAYPFCDNFDCMP